MSQLSGVLAVTAGLLIGMFVLVMTTGKGVSAAALLMTGGLSVAFLVSGVLGAFGRYPGLLASVWSVAAMAFVFFAWGADGGIMDGGIFIFGIFFYLAIGTALSLVGWLRNRDRFVTNT